jgi:hypothetical protein
MRHGECYRKLKADGQEMSVPSTTTLLKWVVATLLMISMARIAISWCIPDHTRITMVTIPQRLVCLVMNLMKRQTSYEWDKSLSRACTTHEPNDETRTVYSCTRMRLWILQSRPLFAAERT